MTDLLKDAQPLTIFAVFTILLLREMFMFLRRKNGVTLEDVNKMTEDCHDMLREATIHRGHQAELMGRVANNTGRHTEILTEIATILRQKGA